VLPARVAADEYSQTLDLSTAQAAVVYKESGVRFTREHIVSATQRDLDRAAKKTFGELRARQREDHQKCFNRVELNLPSTANSTLPTVERLAAFSQGAEDPAWAALYFKFGRYLLISSSQPGGLPLATDRTPLLRAGHKDERVGRATAQAECGQLSPLAGIGHRSC